MIELTSRQLSIFGPRRNGKTLLSVVIANNYDLVFSNFEIKKNGKKINKDLDIISDFEKITNVSLKKGLVIIDEASINASNRASMTKGNAIINQFIVLSGKYNLDIITISQLQNVDKNIMLQNEGFFQIKKYYDKSKNGKIMFTIQVYKRNMKNDFKLINCYNADLFEYMRICGLSYNTTEKSIIKKEKSIKDLILE